MLDGLDGIGHPQLRLNGIKQTQVSQEEICYTEARCLTRVPGSVPSLGMFQGDWHQTSAHLVNSSSK